MYFGLTEKELKTMRPLTAVPTNSSIGKYSKIVSELIRGSTYLFAVRVSEVNKEPRLGPLSKIVRCQTEMDPAMPPRNPHCFPSYSSYAMDFFWLAPLEEKLQSYVRIISNESQVRKSKVFDTIIWFSRVTE